jgi:Uma2 family endonuclease
VTTSPRAHAHDYRVPDPEAALKYAVRHTPGHRVEIVEGTIVGITGPAAPAWHPQRAVRRIVTQLIPVVERLGCDWGAGPIDLPGSANWYVPDLAVAPSALVNRHDGVLTPDRTLLVVEVTSGSDADTERVVKRRRYAEYGAPLYLLVDREERTCTLFREPGKLGYSRADGPYPFGEPVPLPGPFGMVLDTGGLE